MDRYKKRNSGRILYRGIIGQHILNWNSLKCELFFFFWNLRGKYVLLNDVIKEIMASWCNCNLPYEANSQQYVLLSFII